MPFKPGQSGNPNGRPVKNRALTDILTAAGNATIATGDGDKRTARKRVLAALIWQAATTGKVEFEPGRIIDVSAQDWLGIIKFLYSHIDGPPRGALDVSIETPPMKGYIGFSPDEWDESQGDSK